MRVKLVGVIWFLTVYRVKVAEKIVVLILELLLETAVLRSRSPWSCVAAWLGPQCSTRSRRTAPT